MCSASVRYMPQWGTFVRSTRQQSPQSNVLRISKSPDEVRKCVFSKVARLQGAIASLDEDDQERSSLQQVLKRAQQQIVLPPVDQRIADCTQFIERKKRVQIAEADVKKAEVDLQSCKGRGCISTIPPAHRTTADSHPNGDLEFGKSQHWQTEPPRRRLVLVSSTQVDPVPPNSARQCGQSQSSKAESPSPWSSNSGGRCHLS